MEESIQLIRGMPKLWLGAFIPIALSIYYVLATDASRKSKLIIAFLLVFTLVVLVMIPVYWLWVLLFQVVVGIYVAICIIWDQR